MVSKNPPQLLKMTSSKAFRRVQAWLLEKPAAWADDRCLAAAQMAQRPPTKRPREDALLEAERSHQRRRIELLNKHLLGEEAEVRRLEKCLVANVDLEEIMSEVDHVSAALHAPATRSQRAELALRWFGPLQPLLGRTVQFDSETSVGPRICSPMAATTSSAPPSSGKRTAICSAEAASVTPSLPARRPSTCAMV